MTNEMTLEQIRMGSGTSKNNASIGTAVYQHPIVEYMTFCKVTPVA
jgi:hypothetical protein